MRVVPCSHGQTTSRHHANDVGGDGCDMPRKRTPAVGLKPLSPELVVKVMYECSLGLDHMGNTHSLYIIPGVRFASCTEEGV